MAEHLAALSSTKTEGRRHLDELLPAPLYRAVTLVQVHEPALPVAEQLHLDVPRLAEGQGWRVRGGSEGWRVKPRRADMLRGPRRACSGSKPAREGKLLVKLLLRGETER